MLAFSSSVAAALVASTVSAQMMSGPTGGMGGMDGMNGGMMNGMRSPATMNTSSSMECSDVHYFVVRASTEPPGQGIIGTLATMSTAMFMGSTVEWIDYPALLNPYNESSYKGVQALTQRMTSYIDGCEKAKVVLMGYSQGAHVVGDVMCGGGGNALLGPMTPPLDKKYADKVVAMVQMGDPRFVMGKPFDVGSADKMSLFPRNPEISCDAMADRIMSFCDMGDPFCSGGAEIQVHLTYTQRYNEQANEFVMMKLMNAGADDGMMSAGARSFKDPMSFAAATAAVILAVLMI